MTGVHRHHAPAPGTGMAHAQHPRTSGASTMPIRSTTTRTPAAEAACAADSQERHTWGRGGASSGEGSLAYRRAGERIGAFQVALGWAGVTGAAMFTI